MSDKIKNQNIVLKEMINSSWSGMGIISIETKFIYINDAFSPLLGYSGEELLKVTFIDLVSDEYKEKFMSLIQNNLENRYINNMQLSCKRKDGGIVFLNITISSMQDKKFLVLDATDITQTVSEHQIFNKYLIQTELDIHGHIISASEAYCRLSGFTQDELKATLYSLSQNKDEEKLLWDEMKTKNEFTKIIDKKTKDANFFWVESVIKPKYNKYGDVIGFTSVMFDVTNEMSLEEKKKNLLKQIIAKDEKLSIMADTMRLVAHEWRQPLNTISLEVQNLIFMYEFDEFVATDKTIDNLESITRHINDLSSVINNFQHTTEMSEQNVETSCDKIIDSAIDISKVNKENIKIENNISQQFHTFEKSLAYSIAYILTNAQEAIKNANINNGIINISSYIEINKTSQEEDVTFEIKNNGGHIPDDIIENIFTPYFSTKDEKNGVGLSLYNCKTIIELHLKGSINVLNQNDNEVVFKISIPLKVN